MPPIDVILCVVFYAVIQCWPLHADLSWPLVCCPVFAYWHICGCQLQSIMGNTALASITWGRQSATVHPVSCAVLSVRSEYSLGNYENLCPCCAVLVFWLLKCWSEPFMDTVSLIAMRHVKHSQFLQSTAVHFMRFAALPDTETLSSVLRCTSENGQMKERPSSCCSHSEYPFCGHFGFLKAKAVRGTSADGRVSKALHCQLYCPFRI